MMDTDVNGTPFSVLMDRAVKLKSLQMSQERKNYDQMPSFYQHSIFNQYDDVKAVRNLDFVDRIAAARQMKKDGNNAFKKGLWDEAMMHYEKALSVFRYLENTNPEWKNQVRMSFLLLRVSYSLTKQCITFAFHVGNQRRTHSGNLVQLQRRNRNKRTRFSAG